MRKRREEERREVKREKRREGKRVRQEMGIGKRRKEREKLSRNG